MAKSGSGDPSFTSTPRGGAPRYPGGKKGADPARAGKEVSGDPGGDPPVPGSGLRTPGNRGAPARGVDVKPPLGPVSGSRIRGPGDPRDPQIWIWACPGPCPRPRGLGGTLRIPRTRSGRPPGTRSREIPPGPRRRSPEPFSGSPAPGGEVVLHQPLAAGPRGSPGSRTPRAVQARGTGRRVRGGLARRAV